MSKMTIESEKAPQEALSQDALACVFQFFKPAQLRPIMGVSRAWRRVITERALPNHYLQSIPSSLLKADIFEKYPLNKVQLMRCLSFQIGPPTESFTISPFIEQMAEAWELAAFAGNVEALNTLLLGDQLFTQRNSSGANVMHLASMGGQIELLKLLCQRNPNLLTAKDNLGRTALFYAFYFGQFVCASWILKNSTLTLNDQDEYLCHCLDAFINVKLPKLLILQLAFLITGNFDSVNQANDFSAEVIEKIIVTTRAYIEEDNRQSSTLDTINTLIKSSSDKVIEPTF